MQKTWRKVVELLQAGREKIARADHWCRGPAAMDEYRRAVNPESEAARSWCGYGALVAAAGGKSPLRQKCNKAVTTAYVTLEQAAKQLTNNRLMTLVGFNEGRYRQHGDVLRLYDAAIAEALTNAFVSN